MRVAELSSIQDKTAEVLEDRFVKYIVIKTVNHKFEASESESYKYKSSG